MAKEHYIIEIKGAECISDNKITFEKIQPWGTWRDVSEGYKVVCKIKEVENNTRVILCDLLNKRNLRKIWL